MQTNRTRSIFLLPTTLALTLTLGVGLLTMGGCRFWPSQIPKPWNTELDLNASVEQVPPIKLESLGEHHLLIMQAPHSGWSVEIDRREPIVGGVRVFVSVRRPDPAFMYPQAIVEKQLLSTIRTEHPLEVFARVLDSNEKADMQGYGQVTPVEAFDSE